MNKVMTMNYHYKLIELMLKLTFSGVFAANFLAPLIAIYILYDVIPTQILIIWFILHLLVFYFRISIGKKILKVLKFNISLANKYLILIYILLFFSAFLNGIMVWGSVLYDVSPLAILVLSGIVFSLSAGSLSTQSMLFSGFLIYVLVGMSLLISAILYHGGEIFNVFAFLMFVFTYTLLSSGYKHHLTLRDTVTLEDTFETIFNNSSDGIVIINNNRFENCNTAIIDMFKFSSREELLVTPLEKLSPKYQPDGKSSLLKMAKMNKIATINGAHSFEWLHTRLNGEEFWCEIVLTKISLKGKKLNHGVWRDISQRKKMEILEIESKQELERRVALEVENNMVPHLTP